MITASHKVLGPAVFSTKLDCELNTVLTEMKDDKRRRKVFKNQLGYDCSELTFG
jgi:hypothetical protein